MKVRDELIRNNWIVNKTSEEEYFEAQKKYYTRIYLSRNKRRYVIINKVKNYIGRVDTIEEALYLRDLYYTTEKTENIPDIESLDLTLNNPYLQDGLKYPLPERLKLQPPKDKGYGFGGIRKRSNHYRVERNGKYFTTCVTYEQAYFYQQELNRRGWDKKNLKSIADDYPEWYTWLNRFYIYVTPETTDNRYNWQVSLTPANNNGKLETIGYVNLEDALYERDFLMQHNWDYELLVEAIDDNENPYYSMDLPPYPERKIRNLFLDNNHDKELGIMRDYIYEHGNVAREEMANYMNITSVTLTNWLKKYDADYRYFKKLCLEGEDPLNHISMPEHIYTPDLSPCKPKHFRNYVTYNRISKTSPYKIVKDYVTYGVYPTWEIANKVSDELQRLGWSQENRIKLQKKYGILPKPRNKRNIYKTKYGRYSVRKRFKRNSTSYGAYDTWLEAMLVRELLACNGWDKKDLPWIQTEAKKYYMMILAYQNNMFGGKRECTY